VNVSAVSSKSSVLIVDDEDPVRRFVDRVLREGDIEL
jgi:CheY-like chemotaxis protein